MNLVLVVWNKSRNVLVACIFLRNSKIKTFGFRTIVSVSKVLPPLRNFLLMVRFLCEKVRVVNLTDKN